MPVKIYHLDAFANRLFAGNPAAVCLLDRWLPDASLQAIATENHLPATAFLVREDQKYATRWFTPEYEIDLCGHGTLALGYVIFNLLEPSRHEVDLHSPAGLLRISRKAEQITLDFPIKDFTVLPASETKQRDLIHRGLGLQPTELYHYEAERCLAIFETEEDIQIIKPDLRLLKQLHYRGIIVSAPGKSSDFVSRVFYPKKLLSEDAVTGSSHCLLVPYWADKLSKQSLHSRQLSHRGGDLLCKLEKERVYISGQAVLYLEGHLHLGEKS
jgi:PhzF family phenazine biosynthesis protein